jgi:hypothetical protein
LSIYIPFVVVVVMWFVVVLGRRARTTRTRRH